MPGQVRSDRTWRTAEALSQAGFQVTLFFASEHHILNTPFAVDQVGRVLDSGKGYRQCAVPVRPYKENGSRRLLNMVDFAWGVQRLWERGCVETPDAIVASSPHPFVFWVAGRMKKAAGSIFILEERDIWPRSLVELAGASWFHPAVLLFGVMARKAYRQCDALVSLLANSEAYLRRWGLGPGKFHYIPNGVSLDEADNAPREELPAELRKIIEESRDNGEFLVVYTGAMGPPNALRQWFDLAPYVAANRNNGAYPYRVLLIGEGLERDLLTRMAGKPGCDFVSVHGPVSKWAAREVVRLADACAISLRPVPLFQLGVSPNKLFDYFAAAKPVLFLVDCSPNPVEESGAGRTVPSEKPELLHDAVMSLKNMTVEQRKEMGSRGLEYLRGRHDWKVLGERYSCLVRELIESKRSVPAKRKVSGLKRALDLVTGCVALVMLAPLLGLLSLFVALFLGRPVLFRQIRIGQNGRLFELVKFRSMTDARDANGALLPDAERLTKVGRFLRATSLDELPELWNVIRGDLSLVGPRPLLVEYLPLYNAHQARRHEVRPGITGWAQVNGRNATSWEERLNMDVWYVDHRSCALDLWILCRTILVVFGGSGISAEGSVTMPKFTGSPVEREVHEMQAS